MASVIVLVLIVIVSYIIVTAGATAYELTGLDRETARFQALSAFTGTGFTTRVSQRVVGQPVRRRITSTLIILGYGGTASVIASLVTSINVQSGTSTLINLSLLVVAGLVVWLVLRAIGPLLVGDVIRRILVPRMTGDTVPHEELLLYKAGFGITRIEIPSKSKVIGKTLRELDLRGQNMQVLAVEENNVVHPIPDPDWSFKQGNHLIVYGEVRKVKEVFARPH
jgi:hypothetical protein